MATNSWLGGTDTSWDTDANWDLTHKPVLAEPVIINAAPGGNKCEVGPAGAASCASLVMTFDGAIGALDLTNLTVTGNVTLDSAAEWDPKLTSTGNLIAGTTLSGTFVSASSGCVLKGGTFSGTATDCTITGGTFVNITNTSLQTLNNNDNDLTVSGDITLSGAVTHVIQDVGVKTFVIPSTVDIILVGDTTLVTMKNALDNGGTIKTTSGATATAAQLATDIVAVTAEADHIETGTTILTVAGTLVKTTGGILVI
jgi:hypothetical protein